MKNIMVIILITGVVSCNKPEALNNSLSQTSIDSLDLLKMIKIREDAMIGEDVNLAMSQFSDDITWINSQGYYFEGKDEVLKFHTYLTSNDSLDYFYEAGNPKIRQLDSKNALVYYSWKMFWYKKNNQTDTTNYEIGLMTLSAKKMEKEWKWVAVTNQHTPWFYDKIEPVKIE